MNYLLQRVKEAWCAVKNHKLIFTGLIGLQLLLLMGVVAITFIYHVKILQQVRTLIQALAPIQQDPGLLSNIDRAAVSQSYQAIIDNFLLLILFLFLAFVVVNGLLWALTTFTVQHRSFSLKEGKELLRSWLKFLLYSTAVGAPVFLILFFILKQGFLTAPQLIRQYGWLLLLVLGIGYYLLLSFSAFLEEKPRTAAHLVFTTAIKKIPAILPILVLILLVTGSTLYGVYYTTLQDYPFYLTVLLSILLAGALVAGRTFWITCLKNIAHEKDPH